MALFILAKLVFVNHTIVEILKNNSAFSCVSVALVRGKYERTRENKREIFQAYVSGPDCVILFQIFVKIDGNLGYGNTGYGVSSPEVQS